jgi:hypothetical protein
MTVLLLLVTPRFLNERFRMSSLSTTALIALAMTVVLMSCGDSMKHDEGLAGTRAIEFAQAVFVDRNFEKGYDLLSDGGKRHLSREKLKETVTRTHPRGFPAKVTATEFQPMPG